MSQDRGKDPSDSLTTARQGHNRKTFDSPFMVDPTVDGKRDDPVWHFVARGRYLDGSTTTGRKSGRRCLCRLCGRSICGGAKAVREHFSKSEKFRCEAATPAVSNAIWSKDMTKCPKEFVSTIETLQSHLPGHPSLHWPPLRFPEDAVPPLVPPTAPSGAVASPNSGVPAIRVMVPRPATTVATRPAAPPFAPLAGTRGARDVGVGRSTPANEPPPLRDGVGSAAFDEESTRAFIESRKWGGSAGSSAPALAPVFKSARQSDVARGGTAVAPGASPRSLSEHPWLPPPPSRAAQRPMTRCTPAGAPVHSTGAGLEDGEARREPPPHTSDDGLEEGEVAPTPTCGKDREDERPPTDHNVGLDCPPDSLLPTDELFTMDSALASLPDISLLISPTLPVVAPPEPARRDNARRDRGFDEFGGDTIQDPPESGTPAIFHVGAPWVVEQWLAEEVAGNRRGGPHVAAQRSPERSLEAASGDFLAQGGHGSQLLSDGVSSVHPPEEGPQQEPHRGPAETLEARSPGVIRSDGGEGVSEDTAQPGSADGGRSFRGGIERRGSSTAHPSIVRPSTHDVGDGHTDEPRPHLTGMRDIMCPPPSRPSAADLATHGQAAPSALPTRSFYDGAGMDRRAGDIGQTSAYGPADVPAGARSIGNVDGTCHDSMRAYEEQHGRPIRAKTSDVNDTRTGTARLSRARKKGTGVSIPYHRRRLHPFFRNRDETRQMPAAADGQGGAEGGDKVDEVGRGEKRRGGTIILHDDNSTAAEGGETTGTDDPDDSDYVPRIRMADGDDGGGRRGPDATPTILSQECNRSLPVA
ncbi:hypothetical protein CBR_g52162 [Chara braunii]|uniref:Uncharacterized protein n=1 Tax=Chara braunii TaxID=69332 RepID=A0A388M9M3_CHABU|nr:hypothetical protein CBR_g52162 [Chara braunii]|eukprot:GBG91277.1 hypothetical protein CBR_g52162 [Chara braunii]